MGPVTQLHDPEVLVVAELEDEDGLKPGLISLDEKLDNLRRQIATEMDSFSDKLSQIRLKLDHQEEQLGNLEEGIKQLSGRVSATGAQLAATTTQLAAISQSLALQFPREYDNESIHRVRLGTPSRAQQRSRLRRRRRHH